MLTVDTIARIRQALFIERKPTKAIYRELKLSRTAVAEATGAASEWNDQSQGYDQETDRPSVSYADDNGQHVIEGDELLSLDMADHGGHTCRAAWRQFCRS